MPLFFLFPRQQFAMNVASPTVIRSSLHRNMLMALIPYTDYVFGNEEEAVACGEVFRLADVSPAGVAKALSIFPKFNSSRPRVVVFTQGSDPTIVAVDGKVSFFPVPPVEPHHLVDTNGLVFLSSSFVCHVRGETS